MISKFLLVKVAKTLRVFQITLNCQIVSFCFISKKSFTKVTSNWFKELFKNMLEYHYGTNGKYS